MLGAVDDASRTLSVVLVLGWAFVGCSRPAPTPAPIPEPGGADSSAPLDPAIDEPAAPELELRVVAIAAASATSYALMSDGTVRAWGNNERGELGRSDLMEATTPVEVQGVAGAKAIAAGGRSQASTACARLEDGKVKCWGANWGFPLGVDDWEKPIPPTQIESLAGAREISIGSDYGCAIMGDGDLWCWGQVPGWPEFPVSKHRDPVVVPGLHDVSKVRCSDAQHVCVLTQDGAVSCWGDNQHSQVSSRSDREFETPVAIEGIANAIDIAVGTTFSCALLADHTVRCWGKPSYGVVKFSAEPLLPPGTGSAMTAFSEGSSAHACLLDEGGHVHCFGRNHEGQLGIEPESPFLITTPVEVPGLEAITLVVTGDQHTCAIDRDGRVSCWGENPFGSLGDGTVLDRASPKPVLHVAAVELPAPTPPVAPESDVVQDFSNLPAGCSHGALALTASITPKTTLNIKAAYASVDDGGKLVVVNLYDYSPAPGYFQPRADRLNLQIKFTRLAVTYRQTGYDDWSRTDKRMKVVPAVYKTRLIWEGEKVQPTVELLLYTNRGQQGIDSTWKFDKAAQQVELTYIGADWVCGTISLENDSSWPSSLSGRFVAKVTE